MRSSVFVALTCVVLSAAVSILLWHSLPRTAAVSSAAGYRAIDSLCVEVAAVKAGQREIQTEIAAMKASLAALAETGRVCPPGTVGSNRSEILTGEVEVAVAEASQEPADPRESAEFPGSEDTFDLDGALDSILDPHLHYDRKQEVWNELADRGRVDDAVAFFEDRAREDPQDPNAHAELGHAYIQKLLTVRDVEKMQWSMKANASYDQALALDERHWDARFAKAVNFSFVPPALGLQARAIEQFTILRAQQEEQPPQEKFVETYVYLGNLYSSQGNSSKAQEVWQQGLTLFPENGKLKERVRAARSE